MDNSVAKLRDHLLDALKGLPGSRHFHIHVLVSSPKKHTDLFPYAHPRPRVYLQDILILLSEQVNPDAPRVFVTALEVSVYNIPSTNCGVVYISKVDSTGQGIIPSPTPALVKAFMVYYANPATRPIKVNTLWLQLFARAQGQYLFPNSADYSGKRPLPDVKLCAWWKKIFTHVAEETNKRVHDAKFGLYYVLPGLSELEAINTLHVASVPGVPQLSVSAVSWKYGHQYSQTDIVLPCPPAKGAPNLGHFIPSFDDDPKSRFMDEIAHTTEEPGVRSPERKRPRASSERGKSKAERSREEVKEEVKAERVQGELSKVSADEFWERMSFRQECIAGAVTGFFALGIASPPPQSDSHPASIPSPLAPQLGQVAPNLVRRVVASLMNGHEFSTVERAVRGTETLEGAIKGLCENIASRPPDSTSSKPRSRAAASAPLLVAGDRETTPEPAPSSRTLQVPRTPPPKRSRAALPPDISPNPFPEPVASLETYNSHIYGSIAVDNPPLAPKSAGAVSGAHVVSGNGKDAPVSTPPVTILAVRKKKRKMEA